MAQDVQQLIRRYQRAKASSDVWQNYWNAAYSYIFPDRNLFLQNTAFSRAQRKNVKVYDLTAFIDATQFVSQLHLGLTPMYVQWATLIPGKDVPDYLEQNIREGLQEITDILFRFLDGSRFNLVINEAYHDVVIGTGAILCLEGKTDEEPFDFRYVPLQDISIEDTEQSDDENIFRTFLNVPVTDILKLWSNAKLTGTMQHQVTHNTGDKVTLIESTIWDTKKKMYVYSVIDLKEEITLYEEMSESSPWIVFRWNKLRGENVGRGPGISALPTILTLNDHYKNIMRANQIAAYPIYMGWEDGVWNPYTATLTPQTIIPIAPSMGGVPPIVALPQSGQPQMADQLMLDLRQQIHKIFFADPLGGIGEDPNMTATEVNLRDQMALERKAPAIGRMQVELTQKLIRRMVFIAKAKGLIPNIKLNGKQIRIDYKNDLAKLADIQKVNDLLKASQVLQSIIGPQAAFLAFKAAKLPKFVGESYNIDLELINSPAEIEKIQQNMAQQATQQQAGQPGGAQLPSPPVGGVQQVAGPTQVQ